MSTLSWGITGSIGSLLNSPAELLGSLTGLFLEHGYLVVFISAVGDNLGIPATGDVGMFAGGWPANRGPAALHVVMLVGALGVLMAYSTSYREERLGRRAFRPLYQETER